MATDTTVDELRDRVARFEDERAIAATLYRYGDALDYGDRDEFLDCFTPDAHYEVDMRLDPSSKFAFDGHAELTGYFDGHSHAPGAYHKHITTNPLITLEGDTADAQSYFIRVDSSDAQGPGVVLGAGRYIDRFARGDDGKWRIRTRRCEVENL